MYLIYMTNKTHICFRTIIVPRSNGTLNSEGLTFLSQVLQSPAQELNCEIILDNGKGVVKVGNLIGIGGAAMVCECKTPDNLECSVDFELSIYIV